MRHEAALLLGFDNAAEESLATKMAQSPLEVMEFLRDLATRAKPVAQKELRIYGDGLDLCAYLRRIGANVSAEG